jgi:hypothetical protein
VSTVPQRPTARLFAVCSNALLALAESGDPEASWWEFHNCLHTVWMPAGVRKGFGAEELFVFAHITDCQGTFTFGVVVEEVDLANPKRDRIMGRSEPKAFTLPNPWAVGEAVFTLTRIPFPRPGQYRFRLMEGGRDVEGGVTYLRVMPGADT